MTKSQRLRMTVDITMTILCDADHHQLLYFDLYAFTAFTPLLHAESGSILFYNSSFSSLIWNEATFFLLWTIFQLSFCLRQFLTL